MYIEGCFKVDAYPQTLGRRVQDKMLRDQIKLKTEWAMKTNRLEAGFFIAESEAPSFDEMNGQYLSTLSGKSRANRCATIPPKLSPTILALLTPAWCIGPIGGEGGRGRYSIVACPRGLPLLAMYS